MLKVEPFAFREHVLEHVPFTCTELNKVCTSLPQSDAVIRARLRVEIVEVLTIVFPEADRADEVVASLRQRDVVAAGALFPRCQIVWFVPREVVCVGYRRHGSATPPNHYVDAASVYTATTNTL